MTRTKSLTASILAILIHIVEILSIGWSIYVLVVMFALASAGGSVQVAIFGLYLIVALVLMVILLINFILICISFSYVNASHEKYIKRKGVTITIIVFNFILAFLFLLSLLNQNSNVEISGIVISAVSLVMLVLSNILYLIDLSQEKKRVLKNSEATISTIDSPVEENLNNKKED